MAFFLYIITIWIKHFSNQSKLECVAYLHLAK